MPIMLNRKLPKTEVLIGMLYSPEEKSEIENVMEIFCPYITEEPRIDVILSTKFGYLVLILAEGEDERIIQIETHDELIWRLFWEISLAVRNLELDGEQMLPNLCPSEVKEMRRWVGDLLEQSNQRSELKMEIQELLETFLTKHPHSIFQ